MDGGALADGLQATVAVFDGLDCPREPLTTSDVAQQLDVSRRSTYDRLNRLADEGLLETKKVGAKGRVWWRTPTQGTETAAEGSGPGGRERPRDFDNTGPLAESLFENQRDVVYALDRDGTFVRWNDRLSAVTGYTDGEIAEMHAREFVPAEAHDTLAAALEDILARGQSRTVELPIRTADGDVFPYEVSGTPIRDADGDVVGLTGVGRDVSGFTETERHLARQRDEVARELETVLDRVDDAFFALDGDWRVTYVNDRAAEVLDRSPDDLLRQPIWEAVPDAADSTFSDHCHRAVEHQESVTFEWHYEPLSSWFEVSAYPSADGLSVYLRDVTERRARDRELEQYEALAQTATDVIVTIDTDSVIRNVNPAVADVFGYEPGEVIGESLAVLMPDGFLDDHVEGLANYVDGGERALDWEYVELPGVRADDTEIPLAVSFSEYEYGGDRYFTGIVRDVSDRAARERALERYEAIVQTMSDGVYVMDEDGCFVLVNDAFAAMTGYDRSALLGTHGSRLVDDETIERVRQLEAEMSQGERETARVEARLQRADGQDIVAEATFALLDDGDGAHQRVAVVRDVTGQREYERELVRQREQLAALNDLHEVVNSVTDAVLSQSTREEIERTACEHLVDADSYAIAWIAEADPRTGSVDGRVEVGADGSLDAVNPSIAEDAADHGPITDAFRTGEIQVSRDVHADPGLEPWRDAAREDDLGAFAAIPIVYGTTQYSVLGLATARTGAFAEAERAVVGQLGEVIGHAIAAAERKRALLSEEIVELEFRVPDAFDAFDVDDVGQITFDQTIPLGDDDFLIYGHASAGATERLRTLVGRIDHWRSIAVSGDEEPAAFELRLSEPPVLSTLAALGGSVETAVIEGGDYRMVLEVPREADVQRLVGVVTDAYEEAELRSRRQQTRVDESTGDVSDVVDEQLTDRQRATLQAAYHAGFFEWPRETSGQALADTMDVAPPTFHQHLRKAEQTVFESLLGD